ncbi:putative Tumor p63-regulated 1-like protein [Hypsibius exemplaris]|uniref:Tumor p63-regulated 1-like protein n=1 Tax=Hypsibius exemplaris TaxID=2072580 RepID=A0A1W0XAQ8_HYPEX|nr:putative Tumor p63-regulated 1-like protein [Hypsibius exemplaris]
MDNLAEETGPDFGGTRIQLVSPEEAPLSSIAFPPSGVVGSVSSGSVTHEVQLNSPMGSGPELPKQVVPAPHAPPAPVLPPRSLLEYFAFRDGGHTIAKAVQKCLPVVLQSDQADGRLIGAWMLTEISHWDVDQERLVFLTEHTLIIAKYDLIQMSLLEYRRIPLQIVDKMLFGSLRYPEKTMFEDRNQIGLRLTWNSNVPIPFAQRWNPFSEVSYVTLTSHNAVPIARGAVAPPAVSMAASSGTAEEDVMNWCRVEDFRAKVLDAVRAEVESHNGAFHYEETDILIENYAGIASRIFNVAQLGFFKSRGRVSF